MTTAVVEIIANMTDEECIELQVDESSIRTFITGRLPVDIDQMPAHPPIHRGLGSEIFLDRLGTAEGLRFERYLHLGPQVSIPLYTGRKRIDDKHPYVDVDWRFFTLDPVKL